MTSSPADSDRLGPYRAKRSATATPEPFGGTERDRSGIFVVQKHAATRLHYDLRLEHDGVLMSWAVPAGVSLSIDDDAREELRALMAEDFAYGRMAAVLRDPLGEQARAFVAA